MRPGGSEQGATPSGLCANHPTQPAALVCERCGDFVCQACVSAPGLCGTCVAAGAVAPVPKPRLVWLAELWGLTLTLFCTCGGIGVLIMGLPQAEGADGVLIMLCCFGAPIVMPVVALILSLRRVRGARWVLVVMHGLLMPAWVIMAVSTIFRPPSADMSAAHVAGRITAGLICPSVQLVASLGIVAYLLLNAQAKAWYATRP